ncbi:serine/threonine-protein kinase Nek3-like [Engraulis encrasicolus]|uniref:serine/threonine-protein kinase Nek3-like n=1 Tax=Engraulis encrasicolus TaxID=184585 RepID=UPI002FD490EF
MEGTVRLGDFGISKELPGPKAYAETRAGTLFYMAPEVLLSRPYNMSSDVWSLGLVLYSLCKLTYTQKDFYAAQTKQTDLVIPHIYSKDLQNLVKELLRMRPRDHQSTMFLKNLSWLAVYQNTFQLR